GGSCHPDWRTSKCLTLLFRLFRLPSSFGRSSSVFLLRRLARQFLRCLSLEQPHRGLLTPRHHGLKPACRTPHILSNATDDGSLHRMAILHVDTQRFASLGTQAATATATGSSRPPSHRAASAQSHWQAKSPHTSAASHAPNPRSR